MSGSVGELCLVWVLKTSEGLRWAANSARKQKNVSSLSPSIKQCYTHQVTSICHDHHVKVTGYLKPGWNNETACLPETCQVWYGLVYLQFAGSDSFIISFNRVSVSERVQLAHPDWNIGIVTVFFNFNVFFWSLERSQEHCCRVV